MEEEKPPFSGGQTPQTSFVDAIKGSKEEERLLSFWITALQVSFSITPSQGAMYLSTSAMKPLVASINS